MSDDRTVKKAFLGKPDVRRKAGRPKLRWLDCIENDLKSKGVTRWRKKAEGRSAWAIILKEALAKLQRPYVNDEEEEFRHKLHSVSVDHRNILIYSRASIRQNFFQFTFRVIFLYFALFELRAIS